MARLKAIIRGAYGEGNFGDDVLMLAAFEILRKVYAADEIAFVFVSKIPDYGYRYVERLLPSLQIIRFESAAAGAELIVFGGGTQFYSFAQTRTVIPTYRKVLACLFDPARAYNFVLRRLFGGKFNPNQRLAALGVGVGPFVPGSIEETFSRGQFQKMDFVAVRDDASSALCAEWGLQSARQRADLAFVPAGTWWPANVPASPAHGPRSLGIIVRDWPHDASGAAYDTPSLRLAKTLRAAGIHVRFIIFRARADDGWAARLRDAGEDYLIWEPEEQTVADFLGVLASFACLLTARYHGAIFGALLGRPVIPIEIEPKLRLVAELLGTALWRQPFDEAAAVAMIQEILSNPAPQLARQAAAVADQRRLAELMVSEFLEFAAPASPVPAAVA